MHRDGPSCLNGLDSYEGNGNGTNACRGRATGGTTDRIAGGGIGIGITIAIEVADSNAVRYLNGRTVSATATATATAAATAAPSIVVLMAASDDLLELVLAELLAHHLVIHRFCSFQENILCTKLSYTGIYRVQPKYCTIITTLYPCTCNKTILKVWVVFLLFSLISGRGRSL
jgi:hypothetical protein